MYLIIHLCFLKADHRREQLKNITDRIQREIEEVSLREHELQSRTVDSKVSTFFF